MGGDGGSSDGSERVKVVSRNGSNVVMVVTVVW